MTRSRQSNSKNPLLTKGLAPAFVLSLSTVLALKCDIRPASAAAQQAGGAPAAGQGATSPGTAQGTNTGAPGSTGPGTNAPGVNAPTASGTAQTAVASGTAMAAQGNASTGGSAMSGQATAAPVSSESLPRTNPAPDSPNFDLARTISSALASSASLLEAQRTVDIDRKRADEAAAADRPSLAANGSATRFDAATKVAFALPGQAPLPFTVLGDHTEALSINASEDLDLLGLVRAQTSQVRLQALADTFVADSITNQRILQAQTSYFTLLRAIHQVQVGETALRNAQEQQAVAYRLYLGQIGQKIDYLRANTQVAQAQQNLTEAQNNRGIALAAFNDLVGRPLTAPVVVQDVPGVTVGVDIATSVAGTGGVVGSPAAVAPNPSTGAGTGQSPALIPVGSDSASIGFAPFPAPTGDVAAINIDQAITTAVGKRPEILQSATLVRASDVGVRIARSGLEPTFSLSAAGNYYPTTSFQYPRQRTAGITFAVSIPLYDGGRTRDRISEAKLQTQNAQTALDSTKEDVTLQVRQAYLNLSTAARQIDAANSALQEAIAARQLAQVRYEGQVGLYLEVTDAQSALVQAENAQVDAVYNYLIARAQFQNAVGTPQTDSGAAAILPPAGAPSNAAAAGTTTSNPAVTPPTQP